MSQNFETQYAQSLRKVMSEGIRSKNRTGIDTLAIQHQYFFVEDVALNFPIIKGKKVFPMMSLKELSWMMHGKSDVKWLEDRGVKYWKEWADSEGSIGKSYGYQMRNFNGTDQLNDLLIELSTNPESRRLIISLWNHSELKQTTLPPCVCFFQFSCVPMHYKENSFFIDLHVVQRSADSFLGVPYDIMFDGWLLGIIALLGERMSVGKYTFRARSIHHTCNDYHIYENHFEQVNQYLKNVEENKNNIINSRAVISQSSRANNLDEFLKNIELNEYKNFWINKFYNDVYPQIKAPVAI